MGGNQNSAVTLPIVAPATDSSSSFPVNKLAHAQKVTSAPKLVFTQPSTPPAKKPQEPSVTIPKQGLSWVAEPVWIHRRKVRHEREHSHSDSGKSSRSRKAPHPFTLKSRYSPKSPIAPPPALQPLIPGNWSWMSAVGGIGNTASTDLWWAQVSNSLASLSARSYHLHIASGYLTCMSEELLLLYEAQRLNTDGRHVYDEVLCGLRERRLDWEFLRGSDGIAELRISWQMAAKREELEEFGVLLEKRVYRLERLVRRQFEDEDSANFSVWRELQGHVEPDFEDDEGTVFNEPVIHDDSTKKDSFSTRSSSEEPLLAETEAVPVENDMEPVANLADNNISASSISPILTTMESKIPVIPQLNWADEVIEAIEIEFLPPDPSHIDGKTVNEEVHLNENSTPRIPPVECLTSEDFTLSPNPMSEVIDNMSDSSRAKASSQTWAEVVADSVKSQNRLDGWPAISGKSWAWERNWR